MSVTSITLTASKTHTYFTYVTYPVFIKFIRMKPQTVLMGTSFFLGMYK